jgi:hypothetical protein
MRGYVGRPTFNGCQLYSSAGIAQRQGQAPTRHYPEDGDAQISVDGAAHGQFPVYVARRMAWQAGRRRANHRRLRWPYPSRASACWWRPPGYTLHNSGTVPAHRARGAIQPHATPSMTGESITPAQGLSPGFSFTSTRGTTRGLTQNSLDKPARCGERTGRCRHISLLSDACCCAATLLRTSPFSPVPCSPHRMSCQSIFAPFGAGSENLTTKPAAVFCRMRSMVNQVGCTDRL